MMHQLVGLATSLALGFGQLALCRAGDWFARGTRRPSKKTSMRGVRSLPSLCMASALQVILEFLRILRLAKDYIKRFPARYASHFSRLGRKLSELWRLWLGRGTFRRRKPAEPSFVRIGASQYSVSEDSIVKECVVAAASNVPASASHPNLHVAERQLQLANPAPPVGTPPPLDTLSVDHPFAPNPPIPFDGRSIVNRSSGNLSAISIQSERLSSILTNSRDSARAAVGQPSRRAVHRQFGRGPDPSRSVERPSRPPTPSSRSHSPNHPLHIDIITTNPPSPVHGGETSPIVQSTTSSSYTHEPLSPPLFHGNRRRQSSTSVVVDIQNPSTESLPISTDPQPLTEKPFVIDTATVHSSPVVPQMELRDELSPLSSASSSAVLGLHLPDGRFLQLINSDQVPRYTKNIVIAREVAPYDVPPLTTAFPYMIEPSGSEQGSFNQDCKPWIPATHPDGALYFYDPDRKLFTDTDMLDPMLRDEMEDFYDYLQNVIRVDDLFIPSNHYDLVLDIMPTGDGQIQWSYYYACHEKRCLFWLETYDASYMISELFGVKSPAHVKHRLESLYWNHWSLFPVVFDDHRISSDAYDELMGILGHGCVDVLTSKSSTFPYDDDTMHRMIKLVKNAKGAVGGEAYHTAGTTRLLSFFAHWRFLYFHGQKHARLVRDQTVYNKPKRERSLLITLASPLLFLAPEVHLREMEKLWTDEVIIETVWKSFMTKLLGEWDDLILWSTVMLTANVGFLAIPGVILSNLSGSPLNSASDVVIFTSPTQIASCLSIEASIGSIVVSLLLVRHNRTKQKEDPAGAASYLFKNTHRIFGLEPMAIIFSIPWALLMWSMVVFFIALLLLCFTISNESTRIFVAIMSVFAAALIIWCIWTAWDSRDDEDIWESSLDALRRSRRDIFDYVKNLGRDALDSFPSCRTPRRSHQMAERRSNVVV